MKKYFCLAIIIAMLFVFYGCTSTAAPNMQLMKATAASQNEDSAISSFSASKIYVNDELGFSFQIPSSWEIGNYTVTETKRQLPDSKIEFTTVSFNFQNDTENPLLTIELIPVKLINTANKNMKKDEKVSQPVSLGIRDNIAYDCTVSLTCPYEVGIKADLYNSMVLPQTDVPNRFKLLPSAGEAKASISESTSSAE